MEGKSVTDREASTPPRKEPGLSNETDAVDANLTVTNKDELNAKLWGDLQHRITVHVIREKLSQPDLLRLRLVSKDWNDVALRGLLPKPYFVTIASGYHWRGGPSSDDEDQTFLNGIVSYDEASGKCSFMHQRSRLPDVEFHVAPFAVEGLILCHTRGEVKQRGVFNVHNRTWHVIPPPPFPRKLRSACGLMVDTFVRPYTFKLVEGSTEFNTQVYDSESRVWSSTSSRLSEAAMREVNLHISYNCICNKAEIYISLGAHMVLKYSMEADIWTTVALPEGSNLDSSHSMLACCAGMQNALGVWEGRNFITTVPLRSEACLIVWEMVEPEQPKWKEYARVSKDMYKRLFKESYSSELSNRICCSKQRILSTFCDGYLLVCGRQWTYPGAGALLVFNMATKEWKNVVLPMVPVRTYWSPDGEEGPYNPSYDLDSCSHDYEDYSEE